jgi:hypothetical protein
MFLHFDKKKLHQIKRCWLDDGQHAQTCVYNLHWRVKTQDLAAFNTLHGLIACHSKQGMS